MLPDVEADAPSTNPAPPAHPTTFADIIHAATPTAEPPAERPALLAAVPSIREEMDAMILALSALAISRPSLGDQSLLLLLTRACCCCY